MPEYLEKETLILGCGNILLADDGFGFAVVQRLNELKETTPKLKSETVGIIDAGTGASHFILSLIDEESKVKKVIIADIIDYGLKPGELTRLYPDDLPKIPKYHIDAHDMPLAGMLNDIHNRYGIEVVVIGCQYKYMSAPDVCVELSEEVTAAVDKAAEMVLEELEK
ncbi:coenzyme F420-reducing hydrogenase, FrhD protein [Methanimicrococcus blatticola]|uniref:Coenzyme F420 hydrogenase subunit delta n=1 Tax=Methanimicrococcus blatticola TaxID=91560 RepID=A0A484F506_9EURY|nr:coenzyme F420-reducing hydrogenase, FrhD protein [Methanimicrococcus blatticola]MBZ3935582.1 coenzyme F420-reducing hydrogenase, FrhD protein [Methanimicrococcus blatticola]MCC2509223.1 coenzyme F420-reducing hydrogenase, FrhD protein [Methanimicrococcus blatticola]TDQ69410.1 coenzyme F420 hydrogenase subunit delta [Methanimicrococcus blatticola]